MQIRVLGCSGGIAEGLRSTSYLLNDTVLLDGGTGVGDLSFDEMLNIKHVILTHAHLDHIAGLALMIASIYDEAKHRITIHAPKAVLDTLKSSLFNWHLWPDFTELPNADQALIDLHELSPETAYSVTDDIDIFPVLLSHTVESFAYIISNSETKLCFCGDTGPTERLWQVLNELDHIDHLIIEVSLANEQHVLAEQSGHLTAALLAKDLSQLNHSPIVHIQHIKIGCEETVIAQCNETLANAHNINIIERETLIELSSKHYKTLSLKTAETDEIEQNLETLIDVGLSLSAEKDSALLLEKILLAAKEISNADGATIYTIQDERFVHMDIVRNDSLNISIGGSSPTTASFPPLPLYLDDGQPNYSNVVTSAIHDDRIIQIADRHKNTTYDFSGTQRFDESTGYNSISFLTIPMKDHKGQVIGALQLINAQDKQGNISAFNKQDILIIDALASQAAIALTNKNLIRELELLFESFIQMIADAIDEKSPYTGGHCRRVPELTIMLTEAVHNTDKGPMKDFIMSENDRYELKIASWLHDCGKIVTPVHVVDKSTKLETIYDRIHEVNTRFELIRRDLEIELLKQQLAAAEKGVLVEQTIIDAHSAALEQVNTDQEFINRHNTGGEFMSDDDQKAIEDIAKRYSITDSRGKTMPFLSDDEILNLQISRGTLNDEERLIINRHINTTIDMLKSLKLPQHLKNVPEIAGGHHERMDGKGYPFGLTREQMSIQTRVMGIADIFEALTASDRPYKKAKSISESLSIMKHMKNSGHIDPDIFDIFIQQGIYLDYAKKFLMDFQIDDVDAEALLSS